MENYFATDKFDSKSFKEAQFASYGGVGASGEVEDGAIARAVGVGGICPKVVSNACEQA